MADYDPTDPPSFGAMNDDQDEHSPAQREGDDDDDYDPSGYGLGDDEHQQQLSDNDSAQLTPNPSRTASTAPPANAPTQKPRTVGGFIEEESEGEEDQGQHANASAPPVSQLNGDDGAYQGLGAVAQQEMQDDKLSSAQPSEDNAAAAASAVPSAAESSTQSLNGSTTAFAPASTSLAFTTNLQTEGKILSPTPATNGTPAPSAQPPGQQLGQAPQAPKRLPKDKVGQLEDRIAADPKGAIDAWFSLIAHFKEKGQLDNVRKTYEKFFLVFPTAASVWYEYAKMEWDLDNFQRIEQILNTSLPRLPDVRMWNLYLDYLRRIHPLERDTSGQSRKVISQAFDAVLDQVGIDPDAGHLWREYIDFIKSGPGISGGTSWQDAQKMDLLRKAYGRACALPHGDLVKLWKEFDIFELGMNKATGRKILQEKSPAYMTAKTAKTQMDQKLEGLARERIPVLPPLKNCDGREDYDTQIALWKGWVEWEQEDPLVLKDEDLAAFRKRILYVWRQATVAMRFCPELWFEAAQWCFDQCTDEMSQQGDSFLDQGVEANPESALLALKKADRVETQLTLSDDESIAISNGEKLNIPYETCHQALYKLVQKVQEKEAKDIENVKEEFAAFAVEDEEDVVDNSNDDNEDDDENRPKKLSRQEQLQRQIAQLQATNSVYLNGLKKTISYVWIQKMRAFRRVQGQGSPGHARKGFRGVFSEARPRGQLTSDVYFATALMEFHCYRDKSSGRIFERGLKLFPTDEIFALEYIRHLISINDIVNARAVFETTVSRINNSGKLSQDAKKRKCFPLFDFMHGFENAYGDLAQIHRIEKRMKEMAGASSENELARFSARCKVSNYDPKDTEILISSTQIRPRTTPAVVINPRNVQAAPEQFGNAGLANPELLSPRPGELALGPNGPYLVTNSPKRPLEDASDTDSPRKIMRAESPMKFGALGRKVDAKLAAGSGGFMTKTFVPGQGTMGAMTGAPAAVTPTSLPPTLVGLMASLPAARHYQIQHLDPAKMIDLLRGIDIGAARARYA